MLLYGGGANSPPEAFADVSGPSSSRLLGLALPRAAAFPRTTAPAFLRGVWDKACHDLATMHALAAGIRAEKEEKKKEEEEWMGMLLADIYTRLGTECGTASRYKHKGLRKREGE
jgi:hypothetical protein